MDFNRAGDLVKAGEDAARESLGKIISSIPFYRKIVRLAKRFIMIEKQ
jgi:hypothetical protein